jgi:hypothetical protein
MHPTLAATRELIDREAGGLSVAALERPVPGAWSVGYILEHLTLAYRASAASLERALESGELRARRPALTERLARVLVVDLGYFPRAKSPPPAVPTGSIPAGDCLAAIRDALARVDEALSRTAARFGERTIVANHPYFGGLTVAQWRRFHLRHTRHHMRQVRARTR